ncbi:hypothetical protein SAMN05192568_10856 [Methylobacterium pseudosasicola]|uniref:Uncharacterized protein n=2 Tax=Methylobacterium pseudosasicola TaxID=582667 RepID=A0A1I4V2Q9_9HYPH|nr:hypothetical protein SAMN05192568_10856 [Methylobacterium pseudosasicola]
MAGEISDVGLERSEPRVFLATAATWIFLAALYGVFAGSISATEGLAGVVCASLGTLWARRVGRIGDAAFRLRVGMLRPLASAVANLPGQTLRVGFDLMRAIVGGTSAGSIRTRPMASVFQVTKADGGAETQAERALGVFAASLAPRSYVLRLDPGRSEAVLHAFETQPARKTPK